jgi:ferredoxin--NADP+ reductase
MNSKGKEVPHGVRLYSIASSRYGDAFDGKTATLCVRRATYWDPEANKEDPAKKGICSNFLCDAKPGTKVAMTGARALAAVVCVCLRHCSLLSLSAPY